MRFETPLVCGRLRRRYKRFLADVELASGELVTAHCPNTGSMLSVDAPGSEVWLSQTAKRDRKLPYTWELINVGGTLVGINTSRPNAIVAEAIVAGRIPELCGYTRVRREVPYGRNNRIDLLLSGNNRPDCYVEIKNVTLRRHPHDDQPVEFPDARTIRGTRHLVELSGMVRSGQRSVMLFLAQRDDARRFAIADDIDPDYAGALAAARAAGVEMLCYRCRVSTEGIEIVGALTVAGSPHV